MELVEQIKIFRPWNEQEERDRTELLRRLESGEELYTRDNASAHLTASAWVVSPDRRQVLMAWHNLYNSWSWLGGHADGLTGICWQWRCGRSVRRAGYPTCARYFRRSIRWRS